TKQPPGSSSSTRRQSASVWFQPAWHVRPNPQGRSVSLIGRMAIMPSSPSCHPEDISPARRAGQGPPCPRPAGGVDWPLSRLARPEPPMPADRRSFLQASTLALPALAAAGAAARPSEKITLAVLGVNGRGAGLLRGFASFADVEIAYVC